MLKNASPRKKNFLLAHGYFSLKTENVWHTVLFKGDKRDVKNPI